MSTHAQLHNGIVPSPSSSSSPDPTSLFSASSLASLPLDILYAELRRRQDEQNAGGNNDGDPAAAAPSPTKPACGTKGVQAEYSVSSHVFALILILVLSTAACAFPILARRFPKLPVPHHFLFLSRHFGTGVLIATAFVHLLPTAFHSLSNPCLPDFWTKRYTPMPGLVAMIAVIAVVGIEMFFASQGAGHVHGSDFDQPPPVSRNGSVVHGTNGQGHELQDAYEFGTADHKEPKFGRRSRPRGYSEIDAGEEEDSRLYADDVGMNNKDKTHGLGDEGWGDEIGGSVERAATSEQNGHAGTHRKISSDDSDDDGEDLALDLDELDPHSNGRIGEDEDANDLLPSGRTKQQQKASAHARNQSHISNFSLSVAAASSPALAQRLLLQCALLEAGILFHSVFIGMAVSVARGSQFVVLLIAIAFHQTFEGFALGARISSIVPLLPPGSSRPWLMTLAYGATTPIGQAIGLAIHGLYDPKSELGLVLVGCMNAISSGLLLFAGLVELLAEDFLSETSYKILKGRRRVEACLCVVAGAFLMAAVGAFA